MLVLYLYCTWIMLLLCLYSIGIALLLYWCGAGMVEYWYLALCMSCNILAILVLHRGVVVHYWHFTDSAQTL